MIEYSPIFEAPQYPAKTFTQAYLGAMFSNVLSVHGSNREDVWFDPSGPEIAREGWKFETEMGQVILAGEAEVDADYRIAHHAISIPGGQLTLSGLLSQRMRYDRSGAAVEPSRIGASVITPIGSVTLDLAMPSEIFLDQPSRRRDPEELMPPHARVNVVAGRNVFADDILEQATHSGRELPSVQHRHALAALQALMVRTEAPDWPDGSHRLHASDMESAMDFLCAFWNVADLRAQHPNWDHFWQAYGSGTKPVPDLNWQPYSARIQAAQAGIANDASPNRRFPSTTYGRRADSGETRQAEQVSESAPKQVFGFLRKRKRGN